MLKYSYSPNPFPDSQPLDLAQLPVKKLWIVYTKNATDKLPISFFDNGVKIGNSESVEPLEILNGNGWTPPQGTHLIEVKDKNGLLLESATFTVAVPPPPTTEKIIKLNLKSTGETVAEIKYKPEQVEVIQ